MGVTFGSGSAPSQKTINIDSLFAQSLAAYKKTLQDNVAASNAFLYEIIGVNGKGGDAYQSQDGGTHIEVPLMYGLAPMDWYDSYDELPTLPTDGITNAIFQWRQAASAIAYSEKERKQNKLRILNLVQSRIKQSELGIQEGFALALLQGNGITLTTPASSPVNGATGIDPLPLLVAFDPTASVSVGNINQNSSTWWRNKTKQSALSSSSTFQSFLLEWDNIFNSCALGTGGKPTLIPTDQITYELFHHAFFSKYRQTSSDMNFPFENIMFKGARVVMDDKMPDVYAGTTNTATNGTAFFLNMQYFGMTYESETDFVMAKDENGKTFQKPTNGDSRVGHIIWMGNTTVSNRRKQGVFGKIPRAFVEP
jgi:hypothetical protein